MDNFKYIAYSRIVPVGTRCIRVRSEKTPKNVLVAIKTELWGYPTFSYEIRPDPTYLSPYGNLFWMYECVWVEEPIEVTVWEYGINERHEVKVLATVEVKDGDNIQDICEQVRKRWK